MSKTPNHRYNRFRTVSPDVWCSDRPALLSVDQFNASGYGKEDALQIECVKWFKKQYPELELLLVHNLNGAELVNREKQWPHLVKLGAVAGSPDLTLKVPSGDFGCLEIEVKTRKGKQRPGQRRVELATVKAGNAYVIVRSQAEFERVVTGYLENGVY